MLDIIHNVTGHHSPRSLTLSPSNAKFADALENAARKSLSLSGLERNDLPSVRTSTRTLSHSTYPTSPPLTTTNPPHSSNSQDLYSTQLLYAYEAVGSVRLDRDVLPDSTGFPRSEPRMRLGTVREPGYPHMYPRIARTRQRLRGVFIACGGHIWTRRLGVCEILGSC